MGAVDGAMDWAKGVVNAVFDLEKRNREKEELYMKECAPLTEKLYELCKSHGFESVICIHFGNKTHLAGTNNDKSSMMQAIHQMFQLKSIKAKKGRNSLEFKLHLDAVLELLKVALHELTETKKGKQDE